MTPTRPPEPRRRAQRNSERDRGMGPYDLIALIVVCFLILIMVRYMSAR